MRRMNVLGRHSPPASEHWARNAPGWVTQYAGHSRGRVVIDTVPIPWPDRFDRDDDPSLHAAWSMGLLGVGITPGALARAHDDAKEALREAVASHGGFVRLRMSYIPEDGESLIPADRCPLDELSYLTRAAYFILEDEQAFALFVPTAEALFSKRQVWMGFDRAFGDPHKMLTLWTSRRHHPLEDGFAAVDVLGTERLNLAASRLFYNEETVPRKDVLTAAARLTELLATDKTLTEFCDAQDRIWIASSESETSLVWRVS